MPTIRLFRWFVIHVGVALFPVLAALVVPLLFLDPPQVGQPGAGEVLFFSIMICAIAFGDALELPEELKGKKSKGKKLFALAVLGLGLAWVLLLYGANVHHHLFRRDDSQLILWTSVVLAVLFFVVGTLVQVALRDAEKQMVVAAKQAATRVN